MKPRNFPRARQRRIARVVLRNGGELTDEQRHLLMQPKDVRIRRKAREIHP